MSATQVCEWSATQVREWSRAIACAIASPSNMEYCMVVDGNQRPWVLNLLHMLPLSLNFNLRDNANCEAKIMAALPNAPL